MSLIHFELVSPTDPTRKVSSAVFNLAEVRVVSIVPHKTHEGGPPCAILRFSDYPEPFYVRGSVDDVDVRIRQCCEETLAARLFSPEEKQRIREVLQSTFSQNTRFVTVDTSDSSNPYAHIHKELHDELNRKIKIIDDLRNELATEREIAGRAKAELEKLKSKLNNPECVLRGIIASAKRTQERSTVPAHRKQLCKIMECAAQGLNPGSPPVSETVPFDIVLD